MLWHVKCFLPERLPVLAVFLVSFLTAAFSFAAEGGWTGPPEELADEAVSDWLALPLPSLDAIAGLDTRSEEHTSELQSRGHLVCRLLLEKKKNNHHVRRAGRSGHH